MNTTKERLQATPVGQPVYHSARLAPYVTCIKELKKNGFSYGEIGKHFALTARQVAYALNYAYPTKKQEIKLPQVPTLFYNSVDKNKV